MSATVIARDAHGTSRRRITAVCAALGLSVAAILAFAGQKAATSIAARVPALGLIGPGKLGKLKGLTLDRKGKAPKGIALVARHALPGSPLAYEPFFGVAAAAFRDKAAVGGPREAALLREALRRNPRSREARLLLLRHAVGSGELGSAIEQIAVLNRLESGGIEQLMIALGSALSSERQVDEAVAALKSHPELYLPFVQGFVRAKKPAPLAVRLIKGLPAQALNNADLRKLAIDQLVNANAFAEARRLWGNAGQELLHSPDFSDTKSPPPFNWSFTESATGVAERDAGGGAYVGYYGRQPGPILSQLLTLGPGSYSAQVDYATQDGSPGAIELQLTCAGNRTPFASQALDARAGAERRLVVSFTVPPEACQGQILTLAGRVQVQRDSQQIFVKRIEISRGGGQ